MARIFATHRPTAVLHLAAESHVDRSIDGPAAFVHTNLLGTFTLLDAARAYWQGLEGSARAAFRFVHVSTDEVFGSLGDSGRFTEASPYAPASPYAASKAGSDHLALAHWRTWGLPVMVTHSGNNYGPCQFPEKLIPLTILKALFGEPIPVYGSGHNVRDWLHVEDHVSALMTILERGTPGESYNIGAGNERRNLDVVRAVCALLDELRPAAREHGELITFVADRPGHDWRYAIDASRLWQQLDWRPRHTFEAGLRATVSWYLANERWWTRVRTGEYRLERLGTAGMTA